MRSWYQKKPVLFFWWLVRVRGEWVAGGVGANHVFIAAIIRRRASFFV